MTTTNILEKRKKNLEQRKNRLKQLEVSLNAQGRKRRTRRLIEIGGLAAKANLEDWNSNALLGAFLSLKEKESDKKQLEAWTHKGGVAFASEKVLKAPVIVKFETRPTDEIRASLKSLGLKWNALRQEWEGYTKIEELKSLLAPHGASITELDAGSEK
ncbi:MAG: hypothetical protein ACD_16C00191G0007 [uncultured bacterium]|nr:MAG: hypothetical protein ACD_16C00191G0007 [uncultured bacterium]OFW68699.1 MAG: hypothetical protein A2X70_04455 [Alphaproteobacteria bacterium GWC2_42_16]OFW73335.1 MAG: hypothetical protein A2Z80_07545 [Alphaproteobacteria bacterium GWA2_41_27]OFW81801.1 MAG: hypothetical protein A3E50_02810 [Alphaproteobacteria bacterium RIFCSPHIGHO2_12_FULL_42_100]OFW85680.1 MAG: hypothetical protein A2W06_06420 [Alphaproteobacteria bacterium RBG_16_42_14]OFW90827.1 MAG: hypothetical protein A3C41_018